MSYESERPRAAARVEPDAAGNSDQGIARKVVRAVMDGYSGTFPRLSEPGKVLLYIDGTAIVSDEDLRAFQRWLDEPDTD